MVVVTIDDLNVIEAEDTRAQQRQHNDLHEAQARREILRAIFNSHESVFRMRWAKKPLKVGL
jgi:hypothetical protein